MLSTDSAIFVKVLFSPSDGIQPAANPKLSIGGHVMCHTPGNWSYKK